MFAKVTLLADACHWMVQVPVPPPVLALRVAVVPEQMVVPPDTEIEGSPTTVTVTGTLGEVMQAVPVQEITT